MTGPNLFKVNISLFWFFGLYHSILFAAPLHPHPNYLIPEKFENTWVLGTASAFHFSFLTHYTTDPSTEHLKLIRVVYAQEGLFHFLTNHQSLRFSEKKWRTLAPWINSVSDFDYKEELTEKLEVTCLLRESRGAIQEFFRVVFNLFHSL